MKPVTTLCLVLLFSLASTHAEEAGKRPLPSNDWNENTDYTGIRLKYASAPDYNVYAGQVLEKALIAAAMQEWNNDNKAVALTKLEEITEALPLSIETYRRLADGYAVFIQAIKDPEKKSVLEPIERHYRTIAEGLLKSIVASGDGKTPRSAFKVISISEEYMTLWYLDLIPGGQVVEEHDGRHFDVLKVKHRKSAAESTVYFDIHLFRKKETKMPEPPLADSIHPQ